ncbi:MAG: thiamine pyrophosphate-dependent dehydrogenase E1 component subunit alpha [Bdellovibrionales bacterium]|nr:thiamine pyrophosphate-dependent dehydrogenase E1 component subunit alpha [Bdellovibrionales bacterium]
MAKKKKKNKSTSSHSQQLPLPKNQILELYDLMVKARVLEERLIKIYKSGDAYFWIGGPGEEGFGVPLGLLINKGQGHNHDWLHLHYRCSPTLVAMGMPYIDAIRLIMNKATDINTGGRNFANHYCYPEWNVAPVTSPIEVQYSAAIGTAWAQHRENANGITIVSGGDAGTAEGDFASCLVWASRPGNELPLLITVQNNRWGISTSYDTQHGEQSIADRGKAFGMKTKVINANDPIEGYLGMKECIEYIRKNKKPMLVEFKVSRLYGHSSADGANLRNEEDCIQNLEEKLLNWKLITKEEIKNIRANYEAEAKKATEQARTEGGPEANTLWDHVYVDNENADWRNF